ncbi:MAG: deoxyribonuclease IV [Candidatus Paceibacterota bacterium]|jgi:deoxyribonuclease-4
MPTQHRIGAHVSTEGGVLTALDNAQRIGANTIQIFGANPVQWRAQVPDQAIAQQFKEGAHARGIEPVFLHAPYLINLASEKGNLAGMSKTLLAKHLEIANALGAFGVIFHIGSRGERAEKDAEAMVVAALDEIARDVPRGMLIIENSAGAGNLVGDTLEEIGSILLGLNNPRVGFCLDTAHAFAAGILNDFSVGGVDAFATKIDRYVGLEKLWAIHLNDSKVPAGSSKDRHENIGEGLIGATALKQFVMHPAFVNVPMILEVPGFDGAGPDKKNIDIVRSFFEVI